jgi:hypothetical protein
MPDFPRDLWPGVVIVWMFAGACLLTLRPALRVAHAADRSKLGSPGWPS